MMLLFLNLNHILSLAVFLVQSHFLVDAAAAAQKQNIQATLAFGSCLHPNHRPWSVFDAMRGAIEAEHTKLNTNTTQSQTLDRLFLLGDLIYSDWADVRSVTDGK